MSSLTISKRLDWFYNVQLGYENDILKLVGFTKNGSVTSNRVEFNDYLKVSFDLLIYPNAIDVAAILDIDCHYGDERYISLIIKDKKIRVLVKELDNIQIIGILDYTEDWISVMVNISSNNLTINIGEHEINHVFKNKLGLCSVAFGNNYPYKVDHIYSLALKNVEASTENGVFPLIIENVVKNKDMIE